MLLTPTLPSLQEGTTSRWPTTNGSVSTAARQAPPIVAELEAVFKVVPDEELLAALTGPKRRGRRGYDPKILWRCYLAYYVLGLPSVSDLIRTLHNNPFIAGVCGIDSPECIPSQPTFSRFLTKLSQRMLRAAVNRVFQRLTRVLYATLPGFGKSVAMDATDLKAWSNGAHRQPTDKDAGWVIKTDTNGRGKFTWGYKLSVMVDTTYELPMACKVTSGNVHETKAASPLLSQCRDINGKFHSNTSSLIVGIPARNSGRSLEGSTEPPQSSRLMPRIRRRLKLTPRLLNGSLFIIAGLPSSGYSPV